MSVKRYSFMTDLPLRHDEYVLASDYAALEAKYKSAVELLGMMWDRYENGDACYEDPETQSGYLGPCMKLTEAEQNAVIAAIPDHAASKESP
jgi:hypothetical protein